MTTEKMVVNIPSDSHHLVEDRQRDEGITLPINVGPFNLYKIYFNTTIVLYQGRNHMLMRSTIVTCVTHLPEYIVHFSKLTLFRYSQLSGIRLMLRCVALQFIVFYRQFLSTQRCLRMNSFIFPGLFLVSGHNNRSMGSGTK